MLRAILLLFLVVAAPARGAEDCNRDLFYKSWPVENRMDLRQILLMERAVGEPIIYETKYGRKRVGRGTWVDEITGEVHRAVNPNEFLEDKADAETKYGIALKAQLLHIDHIIPLNWACKYGAANWAPQKRRDFATDERLLAITLNSVNASKGDIGADLWQPPHAVQACSYNKTFIDGIHRYGMDVPIEVFSAILDNMESSCRAAGQS